MTFLIILLTILVVLLLLYILLFVRPRNNPTKEKTLLTNYAHRGLHGNDVPENSLQAFELAINNGYGIELDVQLSKDRKVMVFHDYSLLRMTGIDKKLNDLNEDELKNISLASTEQKIPSFNEVLNLVNGRIPLLIELKGEDLNTELCGKVASALTEYKGAYCIESFNPLLIRNIKRFLPDVYCGQLYTNLCREKKKFTPFNITLSLMVFNFLAKPDFIAYNKDDRNSFPVKLTTKLYKAPKFVWTTRGDKEKNTTKNLGEYAIFEKH